MESLKSSVELVDEVTRKITVCIPSKNVSEEIEKGIDQLSRTTALKGFRPGKAPRHLIERAHGDSVRADVVNRMIRKGLDSVVREHKLEVVGTPEVTLGAVAEGKDFEFTAQVSLFPAPEIKATESIAVEVEKREVSDKDVERVMEQLRGSKATMRKLEFRNKAQSGDVVDIALAVEVEADKPARPEPLVIGLGEGRLPGDLEAGIVGMEIAETKVIQTKMGSDHPNESMRGKTAAYRVTLNALFEKVLPDVNDDFAKSVDPEAGTLLGLRVKIRESLEQENERDARSNAQVAVLDKLLLANEFKVPQVLIDDEIRGMLVRAGLMDAKRAESTDLEPFRKELGEVALKRIKSAIIVDRIGEKEGIKASEDDITKEIEQLAERSNVPVEEARKYVMNRERVVSFVMELSRNKVLDHLLSKASISYVPAKEEQPAPAAS